MDLTEKSKKLAYILRHHPESANLKLGKDGYVKVKDLVANTDITIEELKEIVENDKKGRYKFNDDETLIRANQGHSIRVNISFKEQPPPIPLFHGTSEHLFKLIKQSGKIKKMNRNYVHLSKDIETATNVGARHKSNKYEKVIIITIDTKKMYADGIKFFVSDNGVWLTDDIDSQYFSDILEIK